MTSGPLWLSALVAVALSAGREAQARMIADTLPAGRSALSESRDVGLGSAEGEAGEFLAAIRPEIQRLVNAHDGTVGLEILDPVTGDHFGIRADEVFPAASLIKLGIMVEVLARTEEGSLSFDDPLTLLDLDRAPGSGVLQHLTAPKELTVWDALFLMITVSDNTATNLLLDKLPEGSVNRRLAALGMEQSRLLRPEIGALAQESSTPEAASALGIGQTTPHEIADLLARLYRREILSEDASARMLEVLDSQLFTGGLDRSLPEEARVAHKTGSVPGAENDCGIVYGPVRDFVICIMTRGNRDRRYRLGDRALELMGRITLAAYRELNPVIAHDGAPDSSGVEPRG